MTRVRRPSFLTLFVRDRDRVALTPLLRGDIHIDSDATVVAVSLLDGSEHAVGRRDLEALLRVPATEWVEVADTGLDGELVERLADRSLLVTDAADGRRAEMRRRDDSLREGGWERWAAVHHLTSRWRDEHPEVELPLRPTTLQRLTDTAAGFDRAVERHGPPPPHFHRRGDADARVELPDGSGDGHLFDLLRGRESTRLFDRTLSLPLGRLATLLRTVWGCHGTARLADEVTVLKKTSPSGGGLHPIECYPLVRDVEGVEPGLYHYEVEHHRLARLRAMAADEVEETIEQITAGQTYFRSAHALFLMTCRFRRTFWKYRNHTKAYRVVVLDAAHLSQTLFLVAEELGLGAFITAAVNEVDIEDLLGLDPYEEGPLIVCGCGVKVPEGTGMTLEVEPYGSGTSAS